MGKGLIVVEGHGELEAAANLVTRLARETGLYMPWAPPRRYPNLHLERGIRKAAEVARQDADVEALLILRDEDDHCPAERAPMIGAWLRDLALPFPAAVVLFHREYEALFLPCIDLMAGRALRTGPLERPGIRAGASFAGDPERIRGVKEWLSKHCFPAGTSYKPTLDQLALTRMIDFERLRSVGLPCFGSLERGLRFLGEHLGRRGAVYPAART